MAHIKFKGKKKLIEAQVVPVSGSVVRILIQDKPVLTGFRLYLDADGKFPMDNGEYEGYTTLYRQGEGWYELSNDGSGYQEPEAVETVAELPEEPPEEQSEALTEEQQAEQERQDRIAEISGQIDCLKSQLDSTDYQILKNYEYSLVGIDPEYDIVALHQERQGLRDQINQMQLLISDILTQRLTAESCQEPIEESWPDPATETGQDESVE